jgi:hypothetical protein
VVEIRLDKHSRIGYKAEIFLKFTSYGIICYVVYDNEDYQQGFLEFRDHVAHKLIDKEYTFGFSVAQDRPHDLSDWQKK